MTQLTAQDREILAHLMSQVTMEILLGGPGSGHRGHKGRKGQVGGSVAGVGAGAAAPAAPAALPPLKRPLPGDTGAWEGSDESERARLALLQAVGDASEAAQQFKRQLDENARLRCANCAAERALDKRQDISATEREAEGKVH